MTQEEAENASLMQMIWKVVQIVFSLATFFIRKNSDFEQVQSFVKYPPFKANQRTTHIEKNDCNIYVDPDSTKR